MAECPICYDPLETPGLASFRGTCGHAFHVVCLNKSVEAGNKSSCPMCNRDWEHDRVVVVPPKSDTVITIIRDPLEVQRTRDENEYEREVGVATPVVCFFVRMVFFLADLMTFMACTKDFDTDKKEFEYFVFLSSVNGAFYVIYSLSCFVIGITGGISLLANIASRVKCSFRPPYFANMALTLASAAHFLLGVTSARFFMCAACKIAALSVLNAWFIFEKRVEWRATRSICVALAVAAFACTLFDPGLAVGAALACVGAVAEQKWGSRVGGYGPWTHTLLLTLTTFVGSAAKVAVNVYHPIYM